MTILVGQDLILRCREICDVAKEAADGDLTSALGSIYRDLKSYAFKHRIKSAEALRLKVVRKRAEGETRQISLKRKVGRADGSLDMGNPDIVEELLTIEKLLSYEPDHVTDVWGCRFVTLYQNEIPRTVSTLLSRLHEFNRLHNYDIRMVEFVIYTNRPLSDPLSIVDEVLGIVKRSDLARSIVVDDSVIRQPESRKSAYSSVHFVFSRDITIQLAGQEHATETASFEVQVRDIFEEGWGEVQHDLLYSSKDSTDEKVVDQDASNWALHLNALKTFVDGCSQHASIIRRELDARRLQFLPSSNNPSTSLRSEDRQLLIEALRQNGVRRDVELAVSQSYVFLLAAEASLDPDEMTAQYRNAIGRLTEALAKIGDRADEVIVSRTQRSVRYYLATELANCHFLIAEDYERVLVPSEEQIATRSLAYETAAIGYEGVLRTYPTDPTLLLRSSKAQFRLGNLSRALDEITRCTAHISGDRLTGDEHWVAITAWVQKGLFEWVLATGYAADRKDKLRLVETAIASTLQAESAWQKQTGKSREIHENRLTYHKAISNILYYIAETMLVGPKSARYGEGELREYLTRIGTAEVDAYKEYYKTRDNLMHAELALGNKEAASDLARETFSELRNLAEQRVGRPLDSGQIEACLQRSEKPSFRSAMKLLAELRGN
jgi:ppGpp synthetase/RelA/SpoT-type nucleotidyltranferase